MAKFRVFKSTNEIIAVAGTKAVYNTVDPTPLEPVGYFEADGVSDFNHGMRAAIDEHRTPYVVPTVFVVMRKSDSKVIAVVSETAASDGNEKRHHEFIIYQVLRELLKVEYDDVTPNECKKYVVHPCELTRWNDMPQFF